MPPWGMRSSSLKDSYRLWTIVKFRTTSVVGSPPTYAKALHVANEETSFVLMDLATHAPGGLQAPTPGDTSFIAALKAWCTEPGKASTTRRKCYYCDEEGTLQGSAAQPDSRISWNSGQSKGVAVHLALRPPMAVPTEPPHQLLQRKNRLSSLKPLKPTLW